MNEKTRLTPEQIAEVDRLIEHNAGMDMVRGRTKRKLF